MAGRSLKTGVAYHGNRMPSHVRADMAEIARADMDIVVHMLSHTDWERHKTVMKDIFAITEDAGMEVWVDNWGIGGAPGDKSHFLSYHPDAHMYNSDGTIHPYQVCLNSPEYRKFVKEWLDTVAEIGGKTVFWDEPFFPTPKPSYPGEAVVFTCRCPRCQRLYFERYGKEMPTGLCAEVDEFRSATLLDYFGEITAYAASLGLYNAVCVMLKPHYGISLDTLDRICSLPHLHNVGCDPYWYSHGEPVDPYEFVYEKTRKNMEIARDYHKDHNVWIQTYHVPRGREEEIIEATAAAYDAGARTLLAWGFRGSESNDYRAENPERTWQMTVEAMRRIRSVERDRIWEENRKKYMH
ncbi:MAG: hypothetical protein E7663_03360 [Ruminococcaceae bacterium]|nr:hypothetical protein [Oscillospiraceae bacterium]